MTEQHQIIPQTYELWIADPTEVEEESEPPFFVGRVIGWHVPVDLNYNQAAEKIVPVVAYEDNETKAGWMNTADDPWFLGPTRAAAVALVMQHIENKKRKAGNK